MIVKKIKSKKCSTPKARHLVGLGDYIFGIEGDTSVAREQAVKAPKLPEPEMTETPPT